MAKRFISTELFDDEWFCQLSKECKIFFIYFITKCDHAGMLKLNRKLFTFQTEIENIDTVIQELGNSLITVKQDLYFMPKFIKFQYPEFPKSKVNQQISAIKILKLFGLWDETTNNYTLTVNQQLTNCYDNVNVNEVNIKLGIKQNIEKFTEQQQKDYCNAVYENLLKDSKWIETFSKIKKISNQIIIKELESFLDCQLLTKEIFKGTDELRKHFVNLLNKKLNQ